VWKTCPRSEVGHELAGKVPLPNELAICEIHTARSPNAPEQMPLPS
jgi:hypothetical protein